jgi:type VI secretion system protein ImpF
VRERDVSITPSILDRLIDYEPNMPAEPPRSRQQNLRELKQSVRRDIECLLNARCFTYDLDENLEELNSSVAVYGLPDLTGVSAKDPSEQNRMTASIERAIELFEPRFINVRVNLEPVSNVDKQLRFRIEASLDLEPTPEPVVFDTVLEMGSGNFAVVES